MRASVAILAAVAAAPRLHSGEAAPAAVEPPPVVAKLRDGSEVAGVLKDFADGRLTIATPAGDRRVEVRMGDVECLSFLRRSGPAAPPADSRSAARPPGPEGTAPEDRPGRDGQTPPVRHDGNEDPLGTKEGRGIAGEWKDLWRLRKKARAGNLTPAEEKLHGELKRKWDAGAEPLTPEENRRLEKLRARGLDNLDAAERAAMAELLRKAMRPEMMAAYTAALEAKEEGRLEQEIAGIQKEIRDSTDSGRLLKLFLRNAMYLRVRNENAPLRDALQGHQTTMALFREKRPQMKNEDIEAIAILLPDVFRIGPRGERRNDNGKGPPMRRIREGEVPDAKAER
ncbi:MAG: hypothetical protein N3A38_08950 [Planctomycetota bacterium]|nr:hypothetical protein [Planctomycetota bacterium]